MYKYAVLRLLDSFFRHPFLHLVPVMLLTALGVWQVSGQQAEYRSQGVVFVEGETLLSSLTGFRGADSGWQTPAAHASGQLNAMLQTDAFVAAVAERADIGDSDEISPQQIREVRNSVGSWASSQNLLQVYSSHPQPEVAHALASSAIESFVQWQIDTEVSQSTAAEGFFDPLTDEYRDQVEAANRALEDYLLANPAPAGGERTATQELVIDELTAEVSAARVRYAEAVSKEESARVATAQAEQELRNQFQVVDEAAVPSAPEGMLKASVTTIAVYLVVGALLTLASVVLSAVADRRIRLAGDVTRRVGVEVLTSVPGASKLHWSKRWRPWRRQESRGGRRKGRRDLMLDPQPEA